MQKIVSIAQYPHCVTQLLHDILLWKNIEIVEIK